MYYAAVLFLEGISTERIDAIRGTYDPTADMVEPHVTVLFPIPESVGEARITEHLEAVAAEQPPFEIRLGGLHRSADHWLFLELASGGDAVRRLHRALYAGILADYRNPDIDFRPHVGLGLLVKAGVDYDWASPGRGDLDRARYEAALAEAVALPPIPAIRIDRFHLLGVPDDVVEWKGELSSFPVESRVTRVRDFHLSGQSE